MLQIFFTEYWKPTIYYGGVVWAVTIENNSTKQSNSYKRTATRKLGTNPLYAMARTLILNICKETLFEAKFNVETIGKHLT